VLAVEHKAFPLAVRWLVEGRVRIDRGTVRVEGVETRMVS